jgi:hypothetical protein
LGYTWAIAERTLPEVNFGRKFPYKYDRRHDFHLVAVYKAKKNIELSGSWTYQSPMPFTVPLAQYERVQEPMQPYVRPSQWNIEYINSRNNIRIAAYHRLDLGISFIKQKKNGNVRTWNISVLNAYNRLNPFFYSMNRYPTSNSNKLTGTSILPVLPSFSYSLKF